MNFRELVNKIADDKGLKAAVFARKMAIKPQKFDSYLNGNPRIDNLLKMAKAMEVHPMELIAAFEPEPEPDNIAAEAHEPWQYPEQPNQPTIMQELEFYKKQNELLQENYNLQKKEIARLEQELKQCQESNRVYPR